MVEDDEEHSEGAEEDCEGVEAVVGDHCDCAFGVVRRERAFRGGVERIAWIVGGREVVDRWVERYISRGKGCEEVMLCWRRGW